MALLYAQQSRFTEMSTSIISRIDQMGDRIADLEASIGELMVQVRYAAQARHAQLTATGSLHIIVACRQALRAKGRATLETRERFHATVPCGGQSVCKAAVCSCGYHLHARGTCTASGEMQRAWLPLSRRRFLTRLAAHLPSHTCVKIRPVANLSRNDTHECHYCYQLSPHELHFKSVCREASPLRGRRRSSISATTASRSLSTIA